MPPIATIVEISESVEEVVGSGNIDTALRVFTLAFVALPACYFLSRAIGKFSKTRFGDHSGTIIQKAIFFTGLVVVVATILLEFGFDLKAILGAAGIASVAIGFAAQSTLSNFISGLFLYGERPFILGDVIKVGDTTGVVLAIDLLSVKLRQFDNQYVRIPNETMFKTQVTTITKFPIRRFDIAVGVSYKEDVDHVIRALQAVADENPLSLTDPAPVIIFNGFGDSSLNFTLGAWCERSQFLALKNSLTRDVKIKFDAEGIEIPFPQRVVHMVPPKS